jgi:threonyl-tRNA synthetase
MSLQDGATVELPEGEPVGAVLPPDSLAARVDGELRDLSFVPPTDSSVEPIDAASDDGLHILRHSTAHVLAQAVCRLHPGAKYAIGPPVQDGFYYDFDLPEPIGEGDLPAIEAEMRRIVEEDQPFLREEVTREEAIARLEDQPFKREIVESIGTAEGEVASGEVVSLYGNDGWVDLCEGPHVPSTGRLGAFTLTSTAGAYWRGVETNPMLTRIYGTAWATQEDLDAHLLRLEEAEKRDHRRLGTQLDLFHMEEEAPGLVFWHPKGWTLWQQVEQYMRRVYRDNGYLEVRGPQILDVALWKRTGHWDNFRENMFFTSSENRDYAVKPMNCPGHILIYNKGVRSYRDLPLRYGEFGSCHRNEPSGALHGLMRVRGFVQDDGHIFCTEEQILGECVAYTALLQKVYRDFGFTDIIYKVATRPAKRIGSDEAWDRAEKALKESLDRAALAHLVLPGEGAFYGPKIEYHLKDSLGRSWQCGTMQVDFSMPGLLGAEYVAEDNTRRTPVMLHRAIVGSFERFIGILIEHYAGAFPVWLAPHQVVVMTITERQNDYARSIANRLANQGLRIISDLRNEKISYKIREHSLQKLPYHLVVGDKEMQAGTVAVRTRSGEDLGAMTLQAFTARLQAEAKAQ